MLLLALHRIVSQLPTPPAMHDDDYAFRVGDIGCETPLWRALP